MSRWRDRHQDERGAIAVVVGLLSVVLFVTAAMAVDLGNGWSRQREVQKQADVAALGAGWLLPMRAGDSRSGPQPIAREVARYLVGANAAPGQGLAQVASTASSDVDALALRLLNGDTSDGEVRFFSDAGGPCTDLCTRMEVTPPAAQVRMYLAGIVGVGGTAVQESASVRVFGALPAGPDLLPFWLPNGCALGSAEADTAGGNPAAAPAAATTTSAPSASSSPASSTTPTPTPSAAPIGPAEEVGTHQMSGASVVVPQGVTTRISTWKLSGIDQQIDRASLRFYPPSGSAYIEYAAQDLKKPQSVLDVPPFQVSTEVTGTPGEWRVYALVRRQGNNRVSVSSNYLTFTVTSVASPAPTPTPAATTSSAPSSADATVSASAVPVGCVGQDRGNFGQLDSPRKDLGTGSTNARLARNIALGLDHQLVPFVWGAGQAQTKTCGKSESSAIDGAQLDSTPLDGRNCIKGDTGNDGPSMMDGLVTGTGGYPGRLSATKAGGHTTCPGRSDTSVNGALVNDDVLSCFLRGGATLADLAQPTGVTQAMLDPRVVDSPRFVWLPVVYATDRAQKDYQPIVDFVPAFITDETQSSAATSSNGLSVNGNSIKTLRVFCFNADALPVDARSSTVDYGAGALRSIVRLVG